MSKHDHLWNDLPFSERKRLSPYMTETQILHLTQARDILVQSHALALKDIDAWISNLRRDLAAEDALAVTAGDRDE